MDIKRYKERAFALFLYNENSLYFRKYIELFYVSNKKSLLLLTKIKYLFIIMNIEVK